MAGRLGYYAHFAWNAVARRRPGPLIFGVAITDRCNLSCRGCKVANTGRPDMTWSHLDELLMDAYARGFREVYFSGGEPTLWRDGPHTIEDAIALARGIGFFHVHLYTNGTHGLDSSADLVWVSVDGLPGTYELRRGDHFAEVEAAIRAPGHPKTAIIYVIDRNTAGGVEPFLEWVRDSRPPVIGVMFYFQTPYYGRDELYLDAAERAPIIDRLLASRRAGLPVLNSPAGLRALQSGRWTRRPPVAVVADVDGESVCCRAPDECCEDCGYAACTEIVEALRLRPSAVLAMGRYW
jgi:Fe-coproporphyrin III synthase